MAREYLISPGYFKILGLPVRAGREFDETDSSAGLAVALVNEAFARSQFPGGNPIGHRIRSEPIHPWRTIVGVVADTHTAGMAKPVEPAFFVPYSQSGSTAAGDIGFLMRTGLDAGSIAPAIRQSIAEIDPRQPVARIERFEERLNDSVAQPRLAAVLLGVFAALGLALASAGLYSVMFVLVRSRFREIGIRLALGGQPRDMAWMVLRSSLHILWKGLALGCFCAVGLGQMVRSMWHGLSPADPVILAGASAVLLLAGLTAAYFPASHASRVDPVEALRNH